VRALTGWVRCARDAIAVSPAASARALIKRLPAHLRFSPTKPISLSLLSQTFPPASLNLPRELLERTSLDPTDMAGAQSWRTYLCCVGGSAAVEDDGSTLRRRRRRGCGGGSSKDSPRSSSSRMSLTSLGSSSETLSPEDLSLTLSGSNLHAFTYAELRSATASFSRANFLGCGGFGPVYRGAVGEALRPGLRAQDVAVKYLDLEGGAQGHKEWLVSG
jgi:hypothetical protein